MRYFLSLIFLCATSVSVFAITLPAPTNLTVTAMRNADGRQYFHLAFSDTAAITDSLSYYRILRWRGAVPDTTERTYIVGQHATSDQTQTYDDTSELFNPSTHESNFPITYSYAVYLEQYVQHPTDSLYAYYSPLSDIVTGNLDSVYLYFSSVPNSSVSEPIHDTMQFTFQAQESFGNAAIVYSAYTSDPSVAGISMDSSTGNFYCVAVGYGSTGVTVKAKDAIGRACYYTFKFEVPEPYDTITVTLKDQSTGAMLAGGTRCYWRLFTPGDSGRENAFSSGTSILGVLGGVSESFTILFPQGHTLHLRVGAEWYNAAWASDSAGSLYDVTNGGSYTIYLSMADTLAVSGYATDTTTKKPIANARMIFIRVTANDGYMGIDTTLTDTSGYYQFWFTGGDSLLGTQYIRVFAYASGYPDSMQYTGFLSSSEIHEADFHFGSHGSSSDTSQYFHIYLATGDTTADLLKGISSVITIYSLTDTGFAIYKKYTTDAGYWPINLYKGKYIIFAQPDSGYQSGYYSAAGYASMWTQADTVVIPMTHYSLNLFVILPKDSTIAVQGGGSHIDGAVHTQFGNVVGSAHLLLYQQVSGAAGGANEHLVHTTTTDTDGNYSFGNVAPGIYAIYVDVVGEAVYKLSGITIGLEDSVVQQNITFNITGVNDRRNALPEQMSLSQNYPNPFSQGTDVVFTVPDANANVTLAMYDEMGKALGMITQGSYAQGVHTIHIDASALPAGAYMYVLRMNGRAEMRQMVVLK